MKILQIFLRYLLVVLIAIPGLSLFYSLFTPLTVFPSFWIFSLILENITLSGNSIHVGQEFALNIIKACVAGSAYYLLFALNMSVPNKTFKKRLGMIGFGFLALLLLNILRIVVLGTMFVNGSSESIFEATHQAFWLIGSTVFVAGVWFAEVKIFKIKEIPVYTDIKESLKLVRQSKTS